jgi:hypothetical protein
LLWRKKVKVDDVSEWLLVALASPGTAGDGKHAVVVHADDAHGMLPQGRTRPEEQGSVTFSFGYPSISGERC